MTDVKDQLLAILKDRVVDFSKIDAFRIHSASTDRAEVESQLFLQDDSLCRRCLFDLENINTNVLDIQQFCDMIIHTNFVSFLLYELAILMLG